jgi:16S rRNA (guanine1516-N2)-methyltransferase
VISITADDVPHQAHARALADELGLNFSEQPPATDATPFLYASDLGIDLRLSGPAAPGPVQVDFGAGDMRHRRRGGQNELLGRAVGVGKREHLQVIDATAGLGRDGFVLADLGCQVVMLERSPVAFCLLRNGLERACASGDHWLLEACSRLRLHWVDSIDYLADRADPVDVIYLDPMFPDRQKTARVRKEMWMFQELLGKDMDSEQLLEVALQRATYRVVVKRPARAPVLAGRAPGFTIGGRKVRFDVYPAQQGT